MGQLASRINRAYFLKHVLWSLRSCTRRQQLLAASHLLVLATADASDDRVELLSVGAAGVGGAVGDEALGGAGGGGGAVRVLVSSGEHVLETVECCLRRLWPAPSSTAASEMMMSSGASAAAAAQLPTNPLEIEDSVSMSGNLCQVLARCMSTLDVEGPLFVTAAAAAVGSDGGGRRQSTPLVARLLRTLLMLVGEKGLWEIVSHCTALHCTALRCVCPCPLLSSRTSHYTLDSRH